MVALSEREVRARDGVRLACRVAGTGPPVVLLHGLAMWSQMWVDDGVAARLAEAHTVLLPDRRGHGRSGRPRGAGRYGRAIVEDVFDVMDAEGLAAAHLVGFSQGAEVALCAATTRPERVRSLVLMASGWPGPEMEEALRIYGEILAWLRRKVDAGVDWMTPEPDLDALEAIVAGIAPVIDLPRARIAALDLPALGVAGEDDPERPTLDRLVGVLPGFALDVLPGTNHMGVWTHPTIPDRIAAFLADATADEPRRGRRAGRASPGPFRSTRPPLA